MGFVLSNSQVGGMLFRKQNGINMLDVAVDSFSMVGAFVGMHGTHLVNRQGWMPCSAMLMN